MAPNTLQDPLTLYKNLIQKLQPILTCTSNPDIKRVVTFSKTWFDKECVEAKKALTAAYHLYKSETD